ncbi:hypothetical protein PputUW4_00923 [Pseudomonas sp. UW4]|nr:hypothetical protein PputUW4_00923 [Pseudomonas sp. UW4]
MPGIYAAPQPPVGASLLAKNPRTPRLSRITALSLTTIASRLAPTGGWGVFEDEFQA